MYIKNLLESYSFFGNTAWNYLVALAIFVISLIVLKIFQVVILSRLKKLSKKTKTDMDDILIEIFEKIKPPFYLLISLYIGIKHLILPGWLNKVVYVLLVIVIIYEVVKALERLLDYYVKRYIKKTEKEEGAKKQAQSMMRILKIIIQAGLWTVALLMILSNLGINITSLVASLGIGGIAIALALQNILGDIFSSFSIFIDKPFEVGDFIKSGNDVGTVEKIGLKTTRIRTMSGEELIISNKELTSVRVQNFRRMQRRRDTIKLGVVYETSKEKLEKIPEIIKNIMDSVDKAEFFRCHFVSYGDFSLNFEITYYVNDADYDVFLDLKQKINLKIFDEFKKEGIEFAYPTQLVYLDKS